MRKLKILVVDDSLVVCRLLTTLLSQEPQLEVVGKAENGRITLEKIPHLQPDLVIMDIEMPEMNGLDTLKIIKKRYPSLFVLIFSSFTKRGSQVTVEALLLGAYDYVTKPTQLRDLKESGEYLKTVLLSKIKGIAQLLLNSPSVAFSREKEQQIHSQGMSPLPSIPKKKIEIVVMGASTGGPEALTTILTQLPADFPVPILVVQHMPAVFTRVFAERLNSLSKLKIQEALPDQKLQASQVWIAPGDFHLEIQPQEGALALKIQQDPPYHFCRPSVDVLFNSVVSFYGSTTLAVLLTGMGQDGLQGCEAIRKAQGQIIVQDATSSLVWGMPGQVARAGLADYILPLTQIASEILRLVQEPKKS